MKPARLVYWMLLFLVLSVETSASATLFVFIYVVRVADCFEYFTSCTGLSHKLLGIIDQCFFIRRLRLMICRGNYNLKIFLSICRPVVPNLFFTVGPLFLGWRT
jgi:hypothetical protein